MSMNATIKRVKAQVRTRKSELKRALNDPSTTVKKLKFWENAVQKKEAELALLTETPDNNILHMSKTALSSFSVN